MKKIAKRISMLAVCVLFCLTTLIGLGLFAPNTIAYAASAPKSLRFKQVEVGEDFAIALSYENELFGWSLSGAERKEFRTPVDGELLTQTLGYYYPTVPTKIDFNFRQVNGETIRTDDSILKIATSQTTAAFITSKGYIYTWGYDKEDMQEGGNKQFSLLLLRKYTDATDYKTGALYTPNIVYYNSSDYPSLKELLPNASSGSILGGDIIGGDKNYIVSVNSSAGAVQDYFTWGSSTFYQHFDKTSNGTGLETLRSGFFLKPDSTTVKLNSGDAPVIDIGGATAMYIDGNGIPYFKGKNFYLPNSSNGIIEDTSISMPKLTDATGGATSYVNIGGTKYTADNSVLKDFKQGASDVKLETSTHVANFVKDATTNSVDSSIKVNYKKTDISNGFGYAIGVKDTETKLYFYGNDTMGQSGTSAEISANSAFKEMTLSASFKPVQVAAGKFPTILNSYDNSYSYSSGSSAANLPNLGAYSDPTITFANAYKDAPLNNSYITGVLGENGAVYALSTGMGLTEVPLNKMGVNININNKIVSISSGYGNNLFALSNLGKIYKISLADNYATATDKFVVTLLDNFFYTATDGALQVTEIDKWSVKSNEIRFTKSNARGKVETESYKQIKAKVKMNAIEFAGVGGDLSDAAAHTAVNLNGAALTIASPTFSFMESNAVKDSNRFLVNSSQAINNFITGTGTSFNDQNLMSRTNASGDWDVASTLNFYWATDFDNTTGKPNTGVVPIDKKIVNYYFDFAVNYDGGELSYTIIPYQSTKERKIVMQFGIGRYDAALNYNVNNGSGKQSNTAFYDFKQTTLTISVGNTTSEYRKDINYYGASHPQSGNSIIPMLDPNNQFATKYSLAAMDVSSGFTKLAMELTGETSSTASSVTAIVNSLIELARGGDSGFPSSTKIDKGDLTYYNNNAANYYNDTYHYLSSDRDGNFVYLTGKDTTFSQSNIYDNFNVNIKSINLALPVSTSNPDSFYEELAKPYTGFNNLYGLGLIYDKDKKQLVVSYQVVEVEAIKSTNKVTYKQTTGEDKFSMINSANTIAGNNPMHFFVTQKEMPDSAKFSDLNDEYNKNNAGQSSGNSCDLPVFVQASLSLSGSLITEIDKAENVESKKIIPNHLKYGNSTKTVNNQSVNQLALPDANLRIAVTANEKYSLNINQLFLDTTNIRFSVNSKTTDNDYKRFVETFSTDKATVTLSQNTFTFLPKMADQYTIDLDVHRFDETNSSSIFKVGIQDTEYMTFRLKVVVAQPKIAVKSSVPTSYTVTGEDNKEITLSERLEFDNSELIVINKVMSSSNAVLTVNLSENKKSFTMKGLKSGTAKVFYSASIYGYTVADSFTVVVQSLVETEDVISLLDVKRIYLSDLKNRLQAVNSDGDFQDFSTLELNTTTDAGGTANSSTAIYYQQKDAAGEWVTLGADQKVDFLKSVEVDPDSLEFIRLELSPVSATNVVPPTRIVVKFRQQNSGSARFEIAFQVQPANKLLTTTTGDTLVIGIDVTSDKIKSPENDSGRFPSISGTKGAYIVDIPMEYLIGFLPNTKPDNMKIITVTTDEGSTKYYDAEVNTTASGIRLLPKYPTLEVDQAGKTQKIQVSINDTNKNTTFIVNFNMTIEGIALTLPKETYLIILISCVSGVFALLLIIFVIRMGIFWKKKAQQKKIIKKNQMLIKMRDKMHNKSEAVSREQVVRTKLKMEDPKYAKMFNTMRKDKEEETGITLDSSSVAQKVETKMAASDKAAKATKKKKGGKKSLEDLKAELEAKKSAFQQMQMGDVRQGGMPMEQAIIENAPMFESPNGYSGELTRDDVENQIKAKLASDGDITFDILPNDHENGNN